MEKYNGSGGKHIHDWAAYDADKRLDLMKHQVEQNVYRRITPESALKKLVAATGLEERPLLYEFYQKTFTELSNQSYAFDTEKLQAQTAVIDLCIRKPFSVKLDVSETLRKNSTHEDHINWAPKTFCLTNVAPWERYSIDIYRWTDASYKYFLEAWKYRRKRLGVDSMPDGKDLQYSLAKKFFENYLTKKLKKLVEPMQDPLEIAERDKELRLLINEISKYPASLSTYISIHFEELKKVFPGKPDAFVKLVLETLEETAVHGKSFDVGAFQRRVISYHLDAFDNFVKNDQQKRILQVIRAEIEELIQDERFNDK